MLVNKNFLLNFLCAIVMMVIVHTQGFSQTMKKESYTAGQPSTTPSTTLVPTAVKDESVNVSDNGTSNVETTTTPQSSKSGSSVPQSAPDKNIPAENSQTKKEDVDQQPSKQVQQNTPSEVVPK